MSALCGCSGPPSFQRQGRRNQHIATVVAPLRDRFTDNDADRIANALGVVVGTDAMLAVTDAVCLEGDEARQAMLDAARWTLAGAIAELDPTGPRRRSNRQRA